MKGFAQSLLQVELTPAGPCQWRLLGPDKSESHEQLRYRLPCLQPFVALAINQFRQLGIDAGCFHLQLHDEAPTQYCFRFDAPVQADGLGPLIPDPYVLGSRGFSELRRQFAKAQLPPWRERLNIAIWRGSSTGNNSLNLETLTNNRRYQLCASTQDLKPWLDAKITRVVQCSSAFDQREITRNLQAIGCLGVKASPCDLALHRWIVEIDGNVNSWGLLWKLLSGSCVLRVASQRQQWYYQHLKAWKHLVPIAADLSDLGEVLAWCRSHPRDCEEIARQGQALAMDVLNQLDRDQCNAVMFYDTGKLSAAK